MKKTLLLTSAFVLFATLACGSDNGCPDGEVKVDGSCEPYMASAGKSQGGGSGSGSNQAGSPAQGGTEGGEVAFAALCTTHANCGGPTDYCALSLTEPSYCSAKGCDADPSICPEDWECFDVGQFVPGEPFVCVKPLPPAGNGAFGDACNAHPDCSGETNYCNYSPMDGLYCSKSGCDADPSICPEGWGCIDVGQFAPGEPFVCSKPASAG